MNPIGSERPIVTQPFRNFQLTVPVTPNRVPLFIGVQSTLTLTYDAFIISVPFAAANPIYLGGPNVIGGLASNGLQIRPGIPVQLSINSMRPLYEVQAPLVDAACLSPQVVPLVVWDTSNIFLTADVAAVSCAVLLFQVAFR